MAVEPRRPGDGVPGVAVTASTPVSHRGWSARPKNTYCAARVRKMRISTQERLPRTNDATPANARTFRERGLGLSTVCSDVASVEIQEPRLGLKLWVIAAWQGAVVPWADLLTDVTSGDPRPQCIGDLRRE